MRASTSEVEFSSDMRRGFFLLLKLGAAGSILIFFAAAIGQYRTDRFPAYFDLYMAPLIVVIVCVVMAGLFFAAGKYYKVYVSPQYIYCYTPTGRYRLVYWRDIEDIVWVDHYGLQYLHLYSPGFSVPVTLPMWLTDMPKLRKLVSQYAGADYLLAKYLEEIAT